MTKWLSSKNTPAKPPGTDCEIATYASSGNRWPNGGRFARRPAARRIGGELSTQVNRGVSSSKTRSFVAGAGGGLQAGGAPGGRKHQKKNTPPLHFSPPGVIP